jgi:hypothetical protein
MVGRHRYLEILCAGHVLDDALAIVGPAVDAEGKVSLRRHRRAVPQSSSASPRTAGALGS